STYTDQQLVLMVQEHDERAFVEIYERYWALLFSVALKFTKDRDISMDVVQDIYTDFWSSPARLNSHTSLKSYLYLTVRNRVIDAAKHNKVKERYLNSLAGFANRYNETTDDTVIYREFVDIMDTLITTLPTKMQRIFRMSREEGMSHAEIATQLGISEHTVKKTINRALHVLRAKVLLWLIIGAFTLNTKRIKGITSAPLTLSSLKWVSVTF